MSGPWWRRLATVAICGLCLTASSGPAPAAPLAGVLGANKPDLLMQYIGTASSVGLSPAARLVTVAMARKAIADAHDIGFAYVRIMAAGFGPVAPPPAGAPGQNDLALWQSDSALYWSRADAMFADLDAAGIRLVPSFVWNPMQFPALANETLADLVADPASKSRALLVRYLTEFVSRYGARKTVLFYELTNELNLEADIDIRARCLAALPAANCAAYANITSAQMTEFARELVARIKRLDPVHPVGSGYALPRPAAYHLAAQPDFSPQGPDWTADTRRQFDTIFARTGAPFDLWSVHIYPSDVRWGNAAGSEATTLTTAAADARQHGRHLYLGEFGDSVVSPYLTSMLHRIGPAGVAYASVWVWEFYQQSTWQSADVTSSPPMSLEPGFSDAIDALLERAAGGQGSTAPASVRLVLTTPLPCATLTGPVDLYATASASGHAPVGTVLFSIDGVPINIATSVPFHAAYTPAGHGLHRIGATAYAGPASANTTALVVDHTSVTPCNVP